MIEQDDIDAEIEGIETIQIHMEIEKQKLLQATHLQRQIDEASKELYRMIREEYLEQRQEYNGYLNINTFIQKEYWLCQFYLRLVYLHSQGICKRSLHVIYKLPLLFFV